MSAEMCGQQAAACICIKQPGHVEAGDEVHACDPDRCGGSWTGSEGADDFNVASFPGLSDQVNEMLLRLLMEGS